jgi:RNA polymerase sigma-70 factor, ECF subfamily
MNPEQVGQPVLKLNHVQQREALRTIHVRDQIDVGRSRRIPAGDGTVQTQVENPCGPQLGLVRTQRCDDVLTVHLHTLPQAISPINWRLTDRSPAGNTDAWRSEAQNTSSPKRRDPWRSYGNDDSARFRAILLGYNPVTTSEHRTDQLALDSISQLLRAWSDGDQLALDELTPIVYAELRRLAHRYMRRERPGHDLQTSALVNEAYIRLVDYKRMQWQNRAHFFAVSAQLMRRILVEHARRHNLKRGRGVRHVSLDEAALVGVDPGVDLVALDDALNALARVDPRKVRVVEMRFFSGLSVEETALVLKVSPVTVRRDWSSAKIWLYRELTGETDDGLGSLETAR